MSFVCFLLALSNPASLEAFLQGLNETWSLIQNWKVNVKLLRCTSNSYEFLDLCNAYLTTSSDVWIFSGGAGGGRTKLINTSKLLEILCQLQLFDVSKDLQMLVTFFERAKTIPACFTFAHAFMPGLLITWLRFMIAFSRCLVAKSLPPRPSPSRSIHFWPLKWPETHRPHGTPGKWSNPHWWSQTFFPALPSVFQYHLQSKSLELISRVVSTQLIKFAFLVSP